MGQRTWNGSENGEGLVWWGWRRTISQGFFFFSIDKTAFFLSVVTENLMWSSSQINNLCDIIVAALLFFLPYPRRPFIGYSLASPPFPVWFPQLFPDSSYVPSANIKKWVKREICSPSPQLPLFCLCTGHIDELAGFIEISSQFGLQTNFWKLVVLWFSRIVQAEACSVSCIAFGRYALSWIC